jgi:hypothetical protein
MRAMTTRKIEGKASVAVPAAEAVAAEADDAKTE